jgi:pimeloyl-ACP methyl ester carboxylesterase
VADAVGARELLAPDLRGRGRSRDLPGPYGMAVHADDLVAVLDALGHRKAVLIGHSMGAFVALVAAHRHPDRVAGLVLVDGGLPLPVPAEMDPDEVAEAVIGPSLRRLAMRFADREAHRDLWRAHPALAGEWGPRLAAYADADLHGSEPELAPRTVREAVDADSRDLLAGADVAKARVVLDDGAVLLLAEQGMAVGAPPLYPEDAVAGAAAQPGLVVRRVPAVNHYTVVMSRTGAQAVARAVRSVPAS